MKRFTAVSVNPYANNAWHVRGIVVSDYGKVREA